LGFHETEGYEPIILSVDSVKDCHHQGGTILASARGGFDIEVVMKFLQKYQINQLYKICAEIFDGTKLVLFDLGPFHKLTFKKYRLWLYHGVTHVIYLLVF
jgi:hypothetical protein